MNQLLAVLDLTWDLSVKLHRKSHDPLGRYHMGLGEKTASRCGPWSNRQEGGGETCVVGAALKAPEVTC